MHQAILLLLLPPLPLLAQAAPPRPLEPIDLFRLDYLLSANAVRPAGFVDAAHYLVFDGPPRGRGDWLRIEARSGKRAVLLDRKRVEAGLLAAGAAPDAFVGLADPSHWIFAPDFEQCVLDVGNDLFVRGRDGAVRRLTDSPAVPEEIVQWSPDGSRIGFVRAHDLYVVAASGGPEIAITTTGRADRLFGKLDWVYQEEVFGRGDFRGYWWSPDSSRLVFLELDESPVQPFTLVSDVPARPEVETTHYPKAGEPNPVVWLCVAEAGGGPVRRFDVAAYPDADRLVVRVTWAPDSKEVFFQVQDREQTWLDMLSGDPATGAVRRVFREDSDCWVEPGQDVHWLPGGTAFLWPSERDGCRHLYRYDRDGTLRGRLTAGEWQVKKVLGVDAQGFVWFTADKDSPLETHLYRVAVDGGEVVRVTQGRGTHDVTMAPDHQSFLSTWSSAEHPPAVRLFGRDGSELAVVSQPDLRVLQPYRLAPPEFVQIPNRDGFPMEAMWIRPRGFEPGKPGPVVQLCYAGPHAPRVRDEWGSRDFVWHQLLAQQGFVGFVCDNRSASGKGRKHARVCWRDLGRSELRDLEDGVMWLVEQRIADPARVAIWGWSYGGYQVLYNLTHSDVWRCGVAVNPVTDWRNYDTIYTERYLGLPTTNAAGYDRSSVVLAAKDLRGALLLCAAAMDDNVHMQNSLQFLHELQLAGKDCDFMVYPRVRHGIESLPQQLHLFARFRRFLDRL